MRIGWSFFGCFSLLQIYVFIRLYLMMSCVIPTSSMSPTLIAGDCLIATLQIPGRREMQESDKRHGHYIVKRKEGIRAIRKGDVVVFNFPYSKGEERMIMNSDLYFCKSCTATPGETYNWIWSGRADSVYLPCRGEVLVIDTTNFRHYSRSIEYETGRMPEIKEGVVMHMDTIMQQYRFESNYYFMCGDNSDDSYDSRFWGILPEDFILGVGLFIWFSKEPESGKIRWERMFKGL